MKRKTKSVAGVSIGITLAIGLSACSQASNGTQDSPVAKAKNVQNIRPNQGITGQNNDKASIINFPDTFANVAFKCNGVDGIYTDTRDNIPPVVVPNDPQCK